MDRSRSDRQPRPTVLLLTVFNPHPSHSPFRLIHVKRGRDRTRRDWIHHDDGVGSESALWIAFEPTWHGLTDRPQQHGASLKVTIGQGRRKQPLAPSDRNRERMIRVRSSSKWSKHPPFLHPSFTLPSPSHMSLKERAHLGGSPLQSTVR